MSEYKLVIDTTKYAGNFERETCAHVTGQYGECGVGSETAELARGDMSADLISWCDRHVDWVADESGCSRPATIWPTPGWHNDGMGRELPGQGKYPAYMSVAIHLDAPPPDSLWPEMVRRARAHLGDIVTSVRVERVSVTTKTVRKESGGEG